MRITVMISLLALGGCTPSGTESCQDPDVRRSVSIDSTARIDVVPDTASVQLTFSTLDEDLGVAHEMVETNRRRFVEAIQELDVVVETGVTSYQPQQSREDVVTGYRASQTLHVNTQNFDQIPGIIRRAGPGLHRVSVRHYSSDLVQYRTRLRELAIAAARAKAEALSEGFGVELGPLLTIDEGGAHTGSWGGVGNVIGSRVGQAGGDGFSMAPPGSTPLRLTLRVTFGIES